MTRFEITERYLSYFLGKNPKYKTFKRDLYDILYRYTNIIYNELNNLESNESKKICYFIKEHNEELSKKMDELLIINKNILTILEDNFIKSELDIKRYFNTLTWEISDINQISYYDRLISNTKTPNIETDPLPYLFREKKLIITGNAGFGKTVEVKKIISNLILNYDQYKIIPIYIELKEYDYRSLSIIDLVDSKLNYYINGNSKNALQKLMDEGKLAFFFDGIDDIQIKSKRVDFFKEFNMMKLNYPENIYVATSRKNVIINKFTDIEEVVLSPISEYEIENKFRKLNLHRKVFESYKTLFQNPMLFTIGINLIEKQNSKIILFNRTKIFDEFIKSSYFKNSNSSVLLHQLKLAIGNFAFDNFKKSSFSYEEFERFFSNGKYNFKRQLLEEVIYNPIFEFKDDVKFTHKLFKEYCIAYYLIYSDYIKENKNFLDQKISDDLWKEIFVFMVGLSENLKQQDYLLNFVMDKNLSLYIECVNSKNDILLLSNNKSDEEYKNRLLNDLYNSYVFIVKKYFKNIMKYFAPFVSFEKLNDENEKVILLSNFKGTKLFVQFSTGDASGENIIQLNSKIKDEIFYELMYKHDKIKSLSLDLEHNGLAGDTGRKLALEIISDTLEEILKNYRLNPTTYLLYELRNYFYKDSITEEEKKYLIPSTDKKNDKYVNCYSKERKLEIVKKFFEFAEISYKDMTYLNFPNLINEFNNSRIYPYRLIVEYFEDSDDGDNQVPFPRTNWPRLTIYYLPTNKTEKIEVVETDHSRTCEEIRDENIYLIQNEDNFHINITKTSFSKLIISRNLEINLPLTDHVYSMILKNFKKMGLISKI